jgi:glycosyltransferase involved in cell wall biosynthesis
MKLHSVKNRKNRKNILVNDPSFRITYVTRSFLDYRIPVLDALNRLLSGGLTVVFSADYVPPRVKQKVFDILNSNAIGMKGEKRLGPKSTQEFANRSIRLVYQPGIMRTISENKPDVLIGDGFYQWTSFALAFRIWFGTPLVICYERTFHTERNSQLFRKLYRRMVIRFVDAMSVNGQLTKEYSEWLGMKSARITTGQMVADTNNLLRLSFSVNESERNELRTKWGSPVLVFLTCGQLIKRKGFRELLDSWSILEKEVPGKWRLVIIGSGPMERFLREQARVLNLRSVIFTGTIDYDSIYRYYSAADCFVMPTLEDNWSLVVPEAMACGLPILCSCYNGCYPELIESGGNGWVFDPLDELDTFNSLKRCVINRDRLAKMGQRSREIVAKYSPENAAKAILEACRLAIENN